MKAPVLVIYNPHAGRGRVQALWPQVEQALRQAGVTFDAAATASPLEALALSAQAGKEYAAVVSVGGDGTTHEIVNGLLRASAEDVTIPLGIVPMGTGDDFVKMLPPETPVGGKPFGWVAAVEKIARGQTRLFDVGRIQAEGKRPGLGSGAHYFTNSMSLGFGAQAAFHHASMPRFLKGIWAYFGAIARTMVAFPVLHAKFTLDDQPAFEQASTITAVMNGRCFGNGMWVAPQARIDDGSLDLMIAREISRLTILRLLPKLMQGRHIHEPEVAMYRLRKVVIESADPLVVEVDGEVPFLQARRLEVSVLPGRLRVMV